jgi:hypothetical protein
MEHERLAVTKRVTAWGLVYRIGGTAADGDMLPAEQAADLVARFHFEQSLFGSGQGYTLEISGSLTMPNLIGLAQAVAR